jgi:hypothetical protein
LGARTSRGAIRMYNILAIVSVYMVEHGLIGEVLVCVHDQLVFEGHSVEHPCDKVGAAIGCLKADVLG